ncbi:HAD family hydrolase [Rapidithrix thailandica]|uniref:HAD family hydrolase n=1 Tax=Rapidithrix thailandica TaxID=413964 RepID=A0AAW9S7J5_9BACT
MDRQTEIIVFDLYDTLIEITQNKHFFYQLYQRSYNGFDLSVKAYKNLLLKKSLDEVCNELPSEFEELFFETKAALSEELQSVRLFEETLEVLEKLKSSYRLFLISNLASPYIEPYYTLKLDQYFEKAIFSCQVGFVKPEKQIFEHVQNVSGKKGKQILMVGDSEWSDMDGARKLQWEHRKVSRNQKPESHYEIKNLRGIELNG